MDKCDFCSQEKVTWSYPARDAPVVAVVDPAGHPTIAMSDGAWAACDICHAMIEKGDHGALMERSIALCPQAIIPIDLRHAVIRGIHDRFFELRSGPPVKVG